MTMRYSDCILFNAGVECYYDEQKNAAEQTPAQIKTMEGKTP